MMYEPNKVTTVLKVVVTGEFYDDDATEETLRYLVEQDLEDAGFDVDVSLLKEQEEQIKNRDESLEKAREEIKWLRGMLKEQEAVVLCKDCERRGTYDCPVYDGGDGMYSEPDDWFCADGERK